MSTGAPIPRKKPSLWAGVAGLLADPTVVLVGLVFAGIMGLLAWHQASLEGRLVESTVREEAKRYSEALFTFRSLYTSEVVERLRPQKVVISHDYDDKTHKGKAVPLPATLSMMIGNEITRSNLGGMVALYSGYPFPWRKDEWERRDQFARDAWQSLTQNPDKPFERFEELRGRRWFRYATADRMRISCVECHNSHPQTPKGDWKANDVRGVLEVSLPLDAAAVQTATNLRESILFMAAIGGLGLVVPIAVIRRLRRNSLELEKLVDERTAELAKSNEALEQSNVDLQQFAYTASHDLQTPLRGIASFAQFLKDDYGDKLDKTADGYIERIVGGANRMKQLINDLLAYSRVESRAAPFKATPLQEVFDDALVLLRPSIDDTGAKVTCGVLPTVPGDRAQLSQLFQNLIGNGIKYHGESPPEVHVSAELVGKEWLIAVRDNGIGIDPKHHERIFEIFRRLHTQQAYPGSGIGLSVCRRIVVRHGGRIWVTSEEGKGATFFFTIPDHEASG